MYRVKAWASWADVGTDRHYQSKHAQLKDALRAAKNLPHPLVDVARVGHGIIASRALVPHPQDKGSFMPRTDI